MLAKQTYMSGYILSSKVNCSYFIRTYSTSTTQIFSKSRPKPSKFLVYCNSQITKNGRNGNITEAESVFNGMAKKNIISWTAMLTAYADNGNITKAREVFDEMPERNIASWNAMITACIRNNDAIDDASGLFRQMPGRNAISYAAMITGFVQAGMMEKAEELYAETPVIFRDPVCSNALISGYLKMGDLKQAIRVFEGMTEKDVVSWSSMVDGYCKRRRIVEARDLFDRMQERNVVTWSAMINGYLKMENFREGFQLFLKMRLEDNVKINSTTLTIIFEACGNCGRYREGCQVHGLALLMGFEFDVFLGNSVITMYCRSGLLDEAMNLISSMPFEPHSGVWGALLGASRTHLHLDFAKIAAQHLFELEPNNATPYVVLFDMYSVAGKGKDGEQMRITKKSRGVKKSPGCSWIIVKERVNLFFAGDQSHINFQEIKRTLWTIMDEMKLLNFQRQ
ncbi:hypothetical protein U1Q18_024344 [Sarracenia purpurea var. burkii]